MRMSMHGESYDDGDAGDWAGGDDVEENEYEADEDIEDESKRTMRTQQNTNECEEYYPT